jgi:hypothetical protein
MGRMLSLQAPLSSSGGMGSGAAPVAAAMGAGSSGGGGDVPLEPFSPYDVPAWAAAPTDAVAGALAGSAVEDILSSSVITVGGDVAVAAGPPGWVIGGLIGAATGIFEGLFGGGGSELPPQIRWKLSHRGGDVQEWAQIDGIDPAWAPSWAQSAGVHLVAAHSNQPPLQKPTRKGSACTKEYGRCTSKSNTRAFQCGKSVVEGTIAFSAGCFPLCSATGPGAPECLAGCEGAAGVAGSTALGVCGGIRLGGALNCLVQYLSCQQAQ